MTALGSRLRAARQQLGLTTEQIAASTKLPVRIIDDIENHRFDRLPHGIVGRAHVRAYASALNLDADAAVTAYLFERFGDTGEALPIVRPSSVEDGKHPGWLLLLEVAVIALAVAIFFSSRRAPSPDRLQVESPAEDRIEAALDAPATLPVPVAERTPSELRVEVRPSGPCWISGTADDEPIVGQLLQKGDHAVAAAQDGLVLRVGDPETCAYWINGMRGLQLGDAGKPVTVHITKKNYQAFLAEPSPGSGEPHPGT